jgi:hypothetical protein
MNAELAQNATLVSYGSAFLASVGEAPELTITNSTFKYVRFVRFLSSKGSLAPRRKEQLVAEGTAHWFNHLKSLQVRRLSLLCGTPQETKRPPYVAVAFVGARARHWAILAEEEGKSQVWLSTWALVGGAKPWEVKYIATRPALGTVRYKPDLRKGRSELLSALADIEAFAIKRGLADWTDWFRRAINLMDDVSPTIPYHPDILPASGFTLAARQLLAAASQAWVFGGMGSWNDVAIPGADRTAYRRLTERLYNSVLSAVQHAANSFGA